MKRQAEQGSKSVQKRPRPEPSTPTTPNKLNDHIYELYKPMVEPSMDILFFHGLEFGHSGKSYWKTWMCGDGSNRIWPSTWLVEEYPSAHIFSISYDSSMSVTQEQGRYDLYQVTENLITAIHCAEIGQVVGRPIVLVGHCFGGLVIKDLCVKAHFGSRPPQKAKAIERFLQNLRGFYFYGTPHHGTPVFNKRASFYDSSLLNYVKLLSTESARLEQDFQALRNDKAWHFGSIGESRNTSQVSRWWGGLFGSKGDLVVPESSARYGDHNTAQADHDTLSQPVDKTSTNFQHFTTFLREIQPKGLELFENMGMPRGLVGLDPMIKEVQRMLQKVNRLGIVGMAGVGKTTLAKAVFNKIGSTFEYTSFVAVGKQIDGNVEDVKKKAWDLTHCCGRKMVHDYKEGCWSMLRGKQLLLVLDGMCIDLLENRFQKPHRDLKVLDDIFHDIGCAKSRFIVTCHDGDLLSEMDDIYRVPFLNYTNAKQLFISHAFRKEGVVPIALECKVEAIVEKCDGLPLALEKLGLGLCRKKNDNVWAETLSDLDMANAISRWDHQLWDKLTPSYSGLEENQKQMLLDATTFFNGITGWTLCEAKAAWKITYRHPHKLWQTLVDLSLVYDVEEAERIKVHKLLQSLGRKMACESNKSWIWKFTEGELPHSRDDAIDQSIHALQRLLRGGCPAHICGCHIYVERTGIHKLKMAHFGLLSIGGAQENETYPLNHLVLCDCRDQKFGLDPIWKGYSTHITNPEVQKLYVCGDTFFIEDLRGSISELLKVKSLRISGAYNCKLKSKHTKCTCTS